MAATDLFVENFKGRLAGGGARSNLFKVYLNVQEWGGDNNTASYLCKGASLPASTINEITVPLRGREIFVWGDRKFDPWTITMLNDTDFDVRSAFERWMNDIGNTHTTNLGIQAPVSYKRDMQVEQLDKAGNVLKAYNFVGVFPTVVGEIDVSYDSSDTIEEFPVTLRYDYWTSDTTS